MNDFATLPDAVQWAEGMLLSPQHLQQNDIFWGAHMAHRLVAAMPHAWGVRRLALKAGSPREGKLEIEALECVLPDGALVQFPGTYEDTVLEADVGAICQQPGDCAAVWLVVHERGIDAACSLNKKRRFRSLMATSTRDENTGEGEVQVGRIQLRIELQATRADAAPPASVFPVPLLKVDTDALRHLRVAGYHPPMMRLDACTVAGRESLQARCQQVAQQLWDKARSLAGPRGAAAAGAQPGGNAQNLAAARALASVLPLVEILSSDPATHPARMYEAFALAVGQAAAIGADPVPLKMSAYRHHDCMPQFEAVFDYLHTQLDQVRANHDFQLFAHVAQFHGYDCFARRMPADVGDEVLVEVTHQPGFAATLAKWADQVCIVSESQALNAVQQRLRGAARVLLGRDELVRLGLPPGATVLRIANDPQAPRFILPNQTLRVLTPANMAAPDALSLVTSTTRQAPPASPPRPQPMEELHGR